MLTWRVLGWVIVLILMIVLAAAGWHAGRRWWAKREMLRQLVLNDIYWTREYCLLYCYGVMARQYSQDAWVRGRDVLSVALRTKPDRLKKNIGATVDLMTAIKNDQNKDEANQRWFKDSVKAWSELGECHPAELMSMLAAVREMIEHICLSATERRDSDGADIPAFLMAQEAGARVARRLVSWL
jgi:hypothetical protein